MALLSRHDIITALERLGQLAAANGYTLHLVVVGGAAMVLGYNARSSTTILTRCSYHRRKRASSVLGPPSLRVSMVGPTTGLMIPPKAT